MWPFNIKKKPETPDQNRLDAFGLLAAVSSQCIGPDRLPVMHGVREHPNNVSDSGWILANGHELPEFSSDADNYKLVPLERMIECDPTLGPLLDFPVGSEVTRLQVGEPWRFIVNGQVVDADGRVVGGLR